jgi:alpha/beta superfamily hydrolase
MPDVRQNTVLRAHRRDVVLHTADGLELVGELALPVGRPPVATLVCLHPLPTQGGFMDSHLLRKASYRLPALAGLAVLRFNTRGTSSPRGTSQGEFGNAVDERLDVAAALDLCEAEDLPAIWLLGWSFGTDLALMYGCDPSVVGAVLLSPPLRFSQPEHLRSWTESGKPLVAIVPEHDDYLQPPAARERFAVVPQAEVVAVPGAKHLFVGYTETVLDEVVRRVAPASWPLPRSVPEEMLERAT